MTLLTLSVHQQGICYMIQSSAQPSRTPGAGSRLQQIVEWLGGETFDGALVFDECHKAKNCIAKQASGSSRKQSESKTSRVSISLCKFSQVFVRATLFCCCICKGCFWACTSFSCHRSCSCHRSTPTAVSNSIFALGRILHDEYHH